MALIDAFNTDEGRLGLGLLAAAGPSMQPMGLGQRLVQGMQYVDDTKRNHIKTQLGQMELDELKRKQTLDEQTRGVASRFFTPGTAGSPAMGQVDGLLGPYSTGAAPVAAVPATAPKMDMQGYAQAMMGVNPTEGMKILAALQKETPINKLDVKDFTPASVQRFAASGSKDYSLLERMDKLHFADTGGAVAGLNPFTGAPVSAAPKTGDPFKDYVLSDGSGGMKPNAPFIAAKSAVASAGAAKTNISVNTEKSLLNEIAGGLGKGITDAKGNAQSALSTIATVGRLQDALDSGKVMAGPGTTFRQFGLQVGNMLGVTGKDGNEKMLNTRAAIQSLAQLELDGAQQMKGQGQITEAERSIIKRAASGDVDSMTTGELRLLGGVLDRSARAKIQNYNSQVKPLAANPHASALAPFLNVDEPPARAAAAPGVLRFDAQGNMVR